MTVQELIDILLRAEDKNRKVIVTASSGYLGEYEVKISSTCLGFWEDEESLWIEAVDTDGQPHREEVLNDSTKVNNQR